MKGRLELREPLSASPGRWSLQRAPERSSSFGEDHDGELYAISLGGTVFKIVPAAWLPLIEGLDPV
ncbi:MAG: hypothetical protein ACRDH9_07725 [Actinomycetota bacterium]